MTHLSRLFLDPIAQRFLAPTVMVLLLLSGLSVLSWYGYATVQNALEMQETPAIKRLSVQKAQLHSLQRQATLHGQYDDLYKRMIEKRLIQKQDRVFWADSLTRLADDYLIPELTFTFSSNQPLNSGHFSSIQVAKDLFFFSRVELNMALQHEGDLFRVLTAIQQEISPLYLVESCKLKLKKSGHKVNANFNLLQGNVSASCSLIVFSVHTERTEKK